MTTSDVASQNSPTCAYHEGAPGIAVCTECSADICAACHGSDLRGYCVCASCREKFAPPTTPWEDPRADYSPRAFGQTLWDAIKSPRSFFHKTRFSGSWVPAVVFGAICLAVGLLFSSAWQLLLLDETGKLLAEMADKAGVTMEMARAAVFLAVPVRAVIVFGLHLGLFHLAMKVAGARSNLSLDARIVGYSLSAYAFLLIPPIGDFALGHFLAIIWLFNLEVTAVRLYFRMGVWKSMFAVMVPLLLILPLAA